MARGEVAEKREVAAWSTRWRPHLLRISLLITQRGEARQSGVWRGGRRVTPLRAGLGRADVRRGGVSGDGLAWVPHPRCAHRAQHSDASRNPFARAAA